jgi:hypothetical protein
MAKKNKKKKKAKADGGLMSGGVATEIITKA